MGSMVFTVIAALAQMELEIKRERITDSVAKRRAASKDLGGRRQTFTDSLIHNALRLIEGGEPATLYRRIRQLPSPATGTAGDPSKTLQATAATTAGKSGSTSGL